jgi:OOP family OmpA-OmpF porin
MDIQIAGHTDSQGREQMNLELSEARAQAVLAALAERRAPISRISAKGYGETVPIADNDTEEGREANRRIEFRLLPDEEDPTEAEADGTESDSAEVDGAEPGGAEEEPEDEPEDGARAESDGEATAETAEAGE